MGTGRGAETPRTELRERGGMLPRCQGGAAAAGVGGWGSRGSERLELCAGGHVRVGVRRLLQSGSLRVAATQVLAFVQLQAPLIQERWAP